MINVKKLSFSYGEKKVLDNFSLQVSEGERILLLGKSGCGKTTLLHLICGIIENQSGEISVPNSIGMVFQENRLIAHLTCRENVALSAKKDSEIELIFEKLGIIDCIDKRTSDISGGQKRRVAIARALMFDCGAYIFDEPFTGLDSTTKDMAIKAILEYTSRKSVICVSHNISDAEEMKARIVEI